MIAKEFFRLGCIEDEMLHFSPKELEAFQECALKRKRDWVAGRIAAKKAVQKLFLNLVGTTIPLHSVEILSGTGKRPVCRILSDSEKKIESYSSSLDISIAHSGGVGIGVASVLGRVGGDLERVRIFSELAQEGFLTKREQEFIKTNGDCQKDFLITLLWCFKEAYLKALGTGILLNPKRVEVLLKSDLKKCTIMMADEHKKVSAKWDLLFGEYIFTTVSISKL